MKWIKIFKNWEEAEQRLPHGEVRKLQFSDHHLAIVRRNAELFIFEANCPHQHESLLHARFNEYNEIICPLHEYRFNLKSGNEASARCRNLRTYPVRHKDGIYIGINA